MSASLFLHLPPGALMSEDFASISLSWCRADGDCGTAMLGELLAATEPGCALTVLLSAADVHLTQVEMTRQQTRHIKKVLPFLLEESLLDAPDELLFVTAGKAQGQQRVAALRQSALASLAGFFRERGGWLEHICVDADLLAAHAPCLLPVGDEWLLLDRQQQALVVNAAGLNVFFEQETLARAEVTEFDQQSAWPPLLAAVASGQFIELLQRQWRPQAARQSQASGLWLRWQPSVMLAAALVLLICVGVGMQAWRYNAAEQHWQTQSAQLFAELFPQDRATAKLRAQFKSHLARLQQGQGGADFLSLMKVAGPVLAQQKLLGVNPERIQYDQRNGELLLDIDASSYDSLQTLRNQLLAAHLHAEISVAKTQAKGVSARIKVEQG